MKAFAIQAENRIASLALGGIMVLPLAEIASRKGLGAAIPGSGPPASNLTLWRGRLVALAGAMAGLLINQQRTILESHSVLPWLAIIVIAGVLGAPIFALLGGIAVFASLVRGNPPGVLAVMAYQELTTSTGIA